MSSPESSPPRHPAAKTAMSRALGAAFLTHQVQELERAVASSGRRGSPRGRGRGGNAPASPRRPHHRPNPSEDTSGDDSTALPSGLGAIVLDASVLIHAPAQVKRWCKESAGPDLVVPLEVLNTLDLLKKGASLLAQRARAASRLLESFVGSETRLRVQRDDAFVPWDDIQLADPDDLDSPPPEWLRRTLCCARWEAANNGRGDAVVAVAEPPSVSEPDPTGRFDARADGALTRHWVPNVRMRTLVVRPGVANVLGSGYSPPVAETIVAEPIVAPNIMPRPRGKLFDPHADDGDNPMPSSPRLRNARPADNVRRGNANRRSPAAPRKPFAPQKEKDEEPVRVVRLLARGEKLDP